MNEPSVIVNVKLKNFFLVMMKQHLSPYFLNRCIAEAEAMADENLLDESPWDDVAKNLARRF